MRLVGGALVLDFLNTRTGPPEGPADDDALADYAALLEWCSHADVLVEAEVRALTEASRDDPASAASTFERSLRARDYLRSLFGSITEGRGPRSEDLALLRDDEAEALSYGNLAEDAGFAWSWAGDQTMGRPLRPIIHSAVELLTGAQLDRIKRCAGCSYVFLDESKNRSRRWCSMDDCGSAEKARRYVAARRGRAGRGAHPAE